MQNASKYTVTIFYLVFI